MDEWWYIQWMDEWDMIENALHFYNEWDMIWYIQWMDEWYDIYNERWYDWKCFAFLQRTMIWNDLG